MHARRSRAGQSGQDEIHDGSGVAVRLGGQLCPLAGRAEDHPDHDCPVEAVEQEVNGGVGGKLAAIDGPVQQRSGALDMLALELAPHRIRVNTVHPTGVGTQMILNEATFHLLLPDVEHPTREQAAEVFATTNALPVPWVEPVDISNAVLFLASDEARYVTGTELKIDAGYTVK